MSTPLLRKPMSLAFIASVAAHALLAFSTAQLFDPLPEPVRAAQPQPELTITVELHAQTMAAAAQTAPAEIAISQVLLPPPEMSEAMTEASVPEQAEPTPALLETNPSADKPRAAYPRPVAPKIEPARQPDHARSPSSSLAQEQPALSRVQDAVNPEVAAASQPRESSALPQTSPPPDPAVLADYQRLIQSLLEKNKRYPRQARLRGHEDEIVVRFTIDRHGSLKTASLVSSAGFSALDDAALAAVKNAAPFPAPPAGTAERDGKPFTFEVRIVFSIRS